MRGFIMISGALVLAACARSEAPMPEAPPVTDGGSSAGATDAAEPEVCADASECQALSASLRAGGDPEAAQQAHAAAARGCELGSQLACVDVGLDEVQGLGGVTQDLAGAEARFAGACEAGEATGCRYLGVLAYEGWLGQVDDGAARASFDRGCELGDGTSCFNVGVMIIDGRGGAEATAADAQAYMDRGCAAGDPDSCAAAEQIATQLAAAASKIPDANLRVGSATVDGLTVNSLECRVESGGGGLLGNMVLIAALAERKAKIDKCGEAGAEVEVTWTSTGGRIIDAAGEGKEAQCVAKVLSKLETPVDGECAATIVLGN